ncbi:MAG: M20 family metallopeptidase [Calditrichia bacterium]
MIKIDHIKQQINKNLNEYISIRHKLHSLAEPSWKEFKTTSEVSEILKKMGLELKKFDVLETGGYVDILSDPVKPWIGFRADIDALEVPDDDNLEYRSIHSGICHACGHDFHTTVGLALCQILAKNEQQAPYNYRIIFQPAEEPIPSGAYKIKNHPAIQQLSMIFGIHVEPQLPVGTISFVEGWANASSNKLSIVFKGPGGHSARPQLSQDLLQQASKFILESTQEFNEGLSEEYPGVLVYTMIRAGESYNSIPKKVVLNGTLRITNSNDLERFKTYLLKYQNNFRKNNGLDFTFELIPGAPPVIIKNDIYLSLHKIYRKFLSTEIPVREYRTMGGDDFGWYLESIPGAMIRIGVSDEHNNSEKPLHSFGFDANDDALLPAIFSISVFLLTWN